MGVPSIYHGWNSADGCRRIARAVGKDPVGEGDGLVVDGVTEGFELLQRLGHLLIGLQAQIAGGAEDGVGAVDRAAILRLLIFRQTIEGGEAVAGERAARRQQR